MAQGALSIASWVRWGAPLALTVAVAPAATLLRSPYLQNVGADRATVLWVTREAGEGSVEITTDGLDPRAVIAQRTVLTTRSGSLRYQYRADLQGLTAGRTYRYRVLLDGEPLQSGLSFRTAQRGPLTFLVLGDSGTGSEAQLAVAKRMFAEPDVALVLHVGDISQDDGSMDCMEAHYFSVYAPLMSRAAFFPTLGNHDYGTDLGAPYLTVHLLPPAGAPAEDAGRYYSFDWGDVHFISLDSNLLIHPEMTQRMLAWLEADLAAARRFWKIAYFHHPPFPTGHHLQDELSGRARSRILPVLEAAGVQAVFSGHEHAYERSRPVRDGAPAAAGRGIVCWITGGGGADLHPVGTSPLLAYAESAHHYLRVRVEGPRMEVTAVGADGRILDRSTLIAPPEIATRGVVNAGSLTPELAPGTLVSIFGRNLAVEERAADAWPLPTELGGVSVKLNGEAVPLLFVSPHQINAQLPYEWEGSLLLQLSRSDASAEVPVRLSRAAPAVLSLVRDRGVAPAIFHHASATLLSPDEPAEPGEVVVIYAVGLGPVAAPIRAGQPAPVGVLLSTREPVEVRVADRSVSPLYAGLAPGFAGLYQVNVRLPFDLPAGVHLLSLSVGGAASPAVPLPVGRSFPEADAESQFRRR